MNEMQRTEAAPLEVVAANTAESQAIVAKCGERIEGYNALLGRQERLTDVVRLAIGLELGMVKQQLDHGEFQAFIEKRLPNYRYRTAARWMEFAPTLIAKSDSASLLRQLPDVARDGGIHENDLPAIAREIESITQGTPYLDWLEANREPRAKGGLRKIGFSCPHCSTRNTGLQGRLIKCVNPKCAKKIAVKPDVDPEGETKRNAEAANDNAKEVIASIVTLLEASGEHGALLTSESFFRMVGANKRLTKFLDEAKRLRAASRSHSRAHDPQL